MEIHIKNELKKRLLNCKTTAERTTCIGNFFIESLKQDNKLNPNFLWHEIQESFISFQAGADLTAEQIKAVISADQGWRRSSGIALENAIITTFNPMLSKDNISIHTATEILDFIEKGILKNDLQDIETIKRSIIGKDFDLYLCLIKKEGVFYFGSVQVKTSIRDRLNMNTRPSKDLMEKCFWSVVICIDVDNYLKIPKFNNMAKQFWHGFYVFSNTEYTDHSIYFFNIENLENAFINHAKIASRIWDSPSRIRLNSNWRPTN